ncbi:MAG TPA: hypothetical protein PK156_09405 [Polyangium sp.]|nr:hypothetical protein [Polyangium sp.]
MVRRLILASVCLSGLLGLTGCSPTVPANWAQGGAMLEIPRARWIVATSVVDVFPDGRVLINDNQQMTVDRGGRAWDTNNDPVALLERSGQVVGPGDKPLGQVGVLHAAKGGEQNAWLSVLPSGEVVQYADDGTQSPLGAWVGCNQTYQAHQTCTYLSHLLAPQILNTLQNNRSMYPYGMGMGPSMMSPGMGFWPYR